MKCGKLNSNILQRLEISHTSNIRWKAFSSLLLILLLIHILPFATNVQAQNSFTGNVFIRNDGSIDPPTAPIQQAGEVYTLTSSFVGNITVQKDNIIINGASYSIEATAIGSDVTIGVNISSRSNITITNLNIRGFVNGILLLNSSNCSLIGNNIIENIDGVRIDNSSGNNIIGNNITANRHGTHPFQGNKFYQNNFINSTDRHAYFNLPTYINTWDNGYPTGGNYWSNYTGVDQKKGPSQSEAGSDGTGDTPFVINDNNIDQFPLIAQFHEQGQVQPSQDQTWWFIGLGLVVILVIVIVSVLLYRERAKK